jgi:rhodanese-related sulfurtransferase
VSGLNVLDVEHDGFAGHVTPATAWNCLAENADAVLVDVRTQPEWAFVGLPDLSDAAARLVCAQWQSFPDMAVNPDFAKTIAHEVADKRVAIFTLCRSGMRSQAAACALTQEGFADCYNVAGGFEGDRDECGHRGRVNGWKFDGLPWVQN